MALIKCYECSALISDKATHCPNCGAPVVVHKWRCPECGNMISEDPCPYCHNQKLLKNKSDENLKNDKPDHLKVSKRNHKKRWIILVIIVLIIICIAALLFKLLMPGEQSDETEQETVSVDMGLIGNKISVDGTAAYVAGNNKILVPYDFCGDYNECQSEVYTKSLKGCENPQLPADETEALPEEVAREIIAFYGDTGGFWTSLEAAHANIEISGYEPESMHYAGIMDNYFSVDEDNVATTVYGYCLSATEDSANMGLLVLDNVTNEFEFTDIEDTADPNYSTEPTFYDDVLVSTNENNESDDVVSDDFTSEYEANDDYNNMFSLPIGKYTLSYVFSPFSGWIKVTDSNGNYDENWKSEELKKATDYWEAEDKDPIIETDIQELEEEFNKISPNKYIDVSDKWMKCYNIYGDFDLCKAIADDDSVYETSDTGYGHWIKLGDTDVSMGSFQTFSAEVYEILDDESAYDTYWAYSLSYYPDINGIGVYVDKCEMLFTIQ